MTDQWAHAGGLITGAVLGIVMSPHLRGARVIAHVARVIAIAFALAAAASAVLVARTTITDSLARGPLVTHPLGPLSVRAPARWTTTEDELADPDQLVVLAAQRSDGALATRLEEAAAKETAHAKQLGFEQSRPATERLVPLPAGWQGAEFELTATDALDARQHFRLVVAGRPDGAGIVLAALYVPDTLAREAPSYFTELLGSLR